MLSLVLDDYQVCRGLIAMNLQTLELKAFEADAVIMATGGPGLIFGKSTNSMICTGSAVSAAYQQGAKYANGEFIQVHPTSIPGEDKLRLMSESARGEGGRVWVPKNQGDARNPKDIPTAERWYFLEEKYPAYGNLVPRDIATREIFQVCLEGSGVGGENQVYLDLTHIPAETLTRKLGAILEIYEMFVGDDPRYVPMRIFPGVHYSMGGLWVDFEQRTNIPGLFAAGECDYSIHGANRLGANSLGSCVYGGFTAAPSAIDYAKNVERGNSETNGIHAAELKRQQEINDQIIKNKAAENQYKIHDELGKWMTDNVTVVRYNDRLKATDDKDSRTAGPFPKYFDKRFEFVGDASRSARSTIVEYAESGASHHARRVKSRRISRRALQTGFSRPQRRRMLKTTIAEWSAESPILSYEAVDIGLIEPRKRDYSSGKAKAAAAAKKAARRRFCRTVASKTRKKQHPRLTIHG